MFDWALTYALYCGNPVYAMLINEFKIGIVNVGNALINCLEKNLFVDLIKAIDKDVKNNNAGLAEEMLENLFCTIELQWLKGGKS